MDGADLGDQLSLGLLDRPLALLALGGPGIEGRGRDPSRLTGSDHWEPGGLLGIDAAGAAPGGRASLASTQHATVRCSRSRSIRSRVFSASSWPSRARSSVVSPSASPRSMRSWRTPLPSVES